MQTEKTIYIIIISIISIIIFYLIIEIISIQKKIEITEIEMMRIKKEIREIEKQNRNDDYEYNLDNNFYYSHPR